MDNKEQQEEEAEVLKSIYEGDENFKEVSPTVYQYKVGETDSYKSFLLEISWSEDYPSVAPNITLDAFYNKHLLPEVKAEIKQKLDEQIEDLLETAMTYTLFEFAKENADDLLSNQPDAPLPSTQEDKSADADTSENTTAKTKDKKEQLTKAQKRKMYNRLDNKGEMPRGWNWVDVVKHLSQTGQQSKTEQAAKS